MEIIRKVFRIAEYPNPLKKEPARARGVVMGALSAGVVGLLAHFGVDPTVLAAAAAGAGPIVAAELIRLGVFSPATVAELLGAQKPDGDKWQW